MIDEFSISWPHRTDAHRVFTPRPARTADRHGAPVKPGSLIYRNEDLDPQQQTGVYDGAIEDLMVRLPVG